MQSPPTIFLHYFNPEILRAYGYEPLRDSKFLIPASCRMTRCALAISPNPLLIPVSALFECPYFNQITRIFDPAIRGHFLNFISPTPDIGEYVKKKQYEFQKHRGRYPVYYSGDLRQIAHAISNSMWRPRLLLSASKEIGRVWHTAFLGDSPFWSRLLSDDSTFCTSGRSFTKIESDIHKVPDHLNKRAFVFDEVKSLLPRDLDQKSKTRIAFLINQGYVESYLNEYDAVFLSDTELTAGAMFLTEPANKRRYAISLRNILNDFRLLRIDGAIQEQLPIEHLLVLSQQPEFRVLVAEILKNLSGKSKPMQFGLILSTIAASRFRPKNSSNLNSVLSHIKHVCDAIWKTRERLALTSSTVIHMNKKPNSIFLVHNTNSPAVADLTRLLKSAGISPVHWEEAVNATGKPSPQILEVIRKGFDIATAVLILMTPDESAEVIVRGRKRSRATKIIRPRPNVLVEIGMALGMNADRTVIISAGRLGQISDLDGIHTVRLDGKKESRVALMNRLKQAGCQPSLTDLEYLAVKLPKIQELHRE